MKITSVDINLYQIPLPKVLTDSTHGTMKDFALITVEISCGKSISGLGYTYTVSSIGGRAVYDLAVEDLAPLLLGKNPFYTEKLWDEMYWHLHFVGRGGLSSFAIAAVDIALWDLKAKYSNLPLHNLLGGTTDRVQAYAGAIDLDLSIDELLKQTEGFLQEGFKAIKTKIGHADHDHDINRVKALRKEVGPEIVLMADANMRWNVPQTIYMSNALEEFDLFWLEEPIIPDDVDGHIKISNKSHIPIATGENLHSLYEFQKLIASGSIDFPEPDVATIGGVTPWIKVASLAEAYNLPVTSHGVHDLHVHLLAAVPNHSYLEVHGFGLEPFLKQTLRLHDGYAIVPDCIGHGVEFDKNSLSKYILGESTL
tara:strand:+ start:708 stop:1811 length:1104 start_codon:yes stop_codon:yes gene_type:complete